jgi:hypothetical protein
MSRADQEKPSRRAELIKKAKPSHGELAQIQIEHGWKRRQVLRTAAVTATAGAQNGRGGRLPERLQCGSRKMQKLGDTRRQNLGISGGVDSDGGGDRRHRAAVDPNVVEDEGHRTATLDSLEEP